MRRGRRRLPAHQRSAAACAAAGVDVPIGLRPGARSGASGDARIAGGPARLPLRSVELARRTPGGQQHSR
ncbi:MAG: hypothetical protein AVDCRST_MAG48-3506 [uncultured Friedmanniella sp.]|uniref:Uncharacterized protein n=1 Tax=uncultured Friedmanniella sp. TaxID=335381 RepID=A0A6J4LQU1_9ACTN|nr:MAG: hypothetical protein AVDCRST_MAG48-3506 [uncultured Friedmanniella sp.]